MTLRVSPSIGKFQIIKEKVMKTAVPFFILAAFLVMPCALFAQQGKTMPPAASEQVTEQPAQGAPNPKMMEHHEKMKAEYDKMMKEMDARLDGKIAAMDAAKGEKKVEAMASVIKEMVSQRKEMREHMMKMRETWAEHGKGHKEKGESGEIGDVKGKGM
jgi:hypothetical protein